MKRFAFALLLTCVVHRVSSFRASEDEATVEQAEHRLVASHGPINADSNEVLVSWDVLTDSTQGGINNTELMEMFQVKDFESLKTKVAARAPAVASLVNMIPGVPHAWGVVYALKHVFIISLSVDETTSLQGVCMDLFGAVANTVAADRFVNYMGCDPRSLSSRRDQAVCFGSFLAALLNNVIKISNALPHIVDIMNQLGQAVYDILEQRRLTGRLLSKILFQLFRLAAIAIAGPVVGDAIRHNMALIMLEPVVQDRLKQAMEAVRTTFIGEEVTAELSWWDAHFLGEQCARRMAALAIGLASPEQLKELNASTAMPTRIVTVLPANVHDDDWRSKHPSKLFDLFLLYNTWLKVSGSARKRQGYNYDLALERYEVLFREGLVLNGPDDWSSSGQVLTGEYFKSHEDLAEHNTDITLTWKKQWGCTVAQRVCENGPFSVEETDSQLQHSMYQSVTDIANAAWSYYYGSPAHRSEWRLPVSESWVRGCPDAADEYLSEYLETQRPRA